jgi:hypothetical protein
MKLNPEITKLLKEASVDLNEGTLYLLSMFHELDSDCISDKTIRIVNNIGIVERDYKTNTLLWHVPLYEGQNVDSVWDWVNQYRELFATKNKERAGSKKTCVLRMKLFFAENPHVRKEDVLEATTLYLRTVEPQFVKTAERFIYDGQGNYKTSMMNNWIERVLEARSKNKIDPNNKLMK